MSKFKSIGNKIKAKKSTILALTIVLGLQVYFLYEDIYSEEIKLKNYLSEESELRSDFDTDKTAEHALDIAEFYFKRDSLDYAFKYAMLGYEQDSLFRRLNTIIGRVYFRKKKYDSAVVYLKRELRVNPESNIEYMFIGKALNRLLKPLEAIDYFSQYREGYKDLNMEVVVKEMGHAYKILNDSLNACGCYEIYQEGATKTEFIMNCRE